MQTKITAISMIFVVFFLLVLLGFATMFTDTKQRKVTLNEKIELPFETKDERVILLYFGYVGCRTICVPSLEEISKIYNRLENIEKVSFYFINISHEEVGADEFAKYFNKNFIGVQLSKKETSLFMNKLRAYSSEPLFKGRDMYHTGYLYLITQKKQHEFTFKTMYYTRPFDSESIVADIKQELQ